MTILLGVLAYLLAGVLAALVSVRKGSYTTAMVWESAWLFGVVGWPIAVPIWYGWREENWLARYRAKHRRHDD